MYSIAVTLAVNPVSEYQVGVSPITSTPLPTPPDTRVKSDNLVKMAFM
jgi:hypothetical protein